MLIYYKGKNMNINIIRWIATAAGFFSYFVTMNDYGFTNNSMFGWDPV